MGWLVLKKPRCLFQKDIKDVYCKRQAFLCNNKGYDQYQQIEYLKIILFPTERPCGPFRTSSEFQCQGPLNVITTRARVRRQRHNGDKGGAQVDINDPANKDFIIVRLFIRSSGYSLARILKDTPMTIAPEYNMSLIALLPSSIQMDSGT